MTLFDARRLLRCSHSGPVVLFFFSLNTLQGIAQINLTDYDSSEMQLRWYSVQVFTGPEPPRREEERPGDCAARDLTLAACGKTVGGPALRQALPGDIVS